MKMTLREKRNPNGDVTIDITDRRKRTISERFKKWRIVGLLSFQTFLLLSAATAQIPESPLIKRWDDASYNPADHSLDSLHYWTANILSVHASAGSNTANLSLKDFFNWNGAILRQNIFGTDRVSTGWGRAALSGPGFSFKPDQKSTVTISTRMRILANYWNIDSRILAEIGEARKNMHEYPYALDPSVKMKSNIGALSDIGLSFNRLLVSKNRNRLYGAVTIRYIAGIAHSTLDIQNLSGVVNLNHIGTTSFLSASKGNIQTRTSGRLFNDFSVGNWFNGGKGSVSSDLGLVYEFRPRPEQPYKYRIGVSVVDIGRVRYTADSVWSKTYTAHIPATETGLYFNSNFSNSSFSETARVFDRYKSFFTNTGKDSRNYHVSLPTNVQAFIDYSLSKQFSLNANVIVALTKKRDLNAFYFSNFASIAPRWSAKSLSLSVPLSYQEYGGFNAGVGLQWKNFFIASRSLLTALDHTQNLDMHVGFSINNFHSRSKSRGVRSISSDRSLGATGEEQDTVARTPNTRLADQFNFGIAVSATTTGNGVVPFWMRANRFGSIPLAGGSGAVIPLVSKDYDPKRNKRLWDWGMSLEGRYNLGTRAEAILTEGYLKARLGILQVKIGRSKDITGLVSDSTLSLGAFSVSGNALGIPKIELSIPEYYSLPILSKAIAIKGNFAHGWVGTLPLGVNKYIPAENKEAFTFFHQKSLYVRIAKPEWRLRLYAGANHQAFWSDTKDVYGPAKSTLSRFETFWYIAAGKRYGQGLGLEISKLGNHLGSVDLAVEYEFEDIRILLARQSFYDVGALSKLANIRDGLNGLTITNKRKSGTSFQWTKLHLEYFYSVNQAGELWSKYTRSGDENYYNNYLYPTGWSYRGAGLGSPIITTRSDARKGQVSRESEFFISNRVSAYHFAFAGSLSKLEILARIVYSNNYGTYGSSSIGSSLGKTRFVSPPPYFEKVGQFSGYFEVSKRFRNNLKATLAVASDNGGMLNNSFASYLQLSKAFK